MEIILGSKFILQSSALENKVDVAKLQMDEFCDGATYCEMEELLYFCCRITSAVLVLRSKANCSCFDFLFQNQVRLSHESNSCSCLHMPQ